IIARTRLIVNLNLTVGIIQLQEGLASSMAEFTGSLYPSGPTPENPKEVENAFARVFSNASAVGKWHREAQRLAEKYGM
ncbi:MAG TPA: hypothetical protein PLA50_03800, partial [Bacteroidia bacterium]|nr:hypothetical protein [Bacteroidia bacterium]